MPILGSRGAASARGFGFAGNSRYWYVGYSGFSSVAITNQQLVFGGLNLFKLGSTPALSYAKTLTFPPSPAPYTLASSDAASSSTTYTCAGYQSDGYGGYVICFNNSDGSINWQKQIVSIAAIDESIYLYSDTVGYYVDDFGASGPQIIKFNPTDGTILASAVVSSATQQRENAKVRIFSDGTHLYIARSVFTNTGGSPAQTYGVDTIKVTVDLSTVVAARYYRNTLLGYSNADVGDITVDASGNVYTTLYAESSSVTKLFVVKYNSSMTYIGTLSSQFSITPKSIWTDSTYLYVYGYYSSLSAAYLLKITLSTFAVYGQTKITGSVNGANNAVLLSNGNIFSSMSTTTPAAGGNLYVPKDLSTIYGTYTNKYSASTITIAAEGQTFSSTALSSANVTYTIASFSFTPTTQAVTIASASPSQISLYQMG